MSKLSLLVLASVCGLCFLMSTTTAQECAGQAVSDFLTCVDTAHKAKEASMKTKMDEMKKKGEEMKATAEKCFVDNGCTAPQKPEFGHGGPGGRFGGGHRGGPRGDRRGHSGSGDGAEWAEKKEKTEEERNKTRACKEAVGEKMGQRIQDCVNKATGLTLPKFGGAGAHHGGPQHGGPRGGFGGQHGGFGGGHDGPHGGPPPPPPHFGSGSGFGGPEGFHGGFPGGFGGHHDESSSEEVHPTMESFKAKAKEFIQKQCVNASDANAAADKVAQCLNDTFQAAKNEFIKNAPAPGQAFDVAKLPADFQQFCSAKNSCVLALNTAGCNESQVHETLKKAMQAGKECFKTEMETIKANKEDLAAGLDQCQGVNLTQHDGGHHPGGFAKGPSGEGSSESNEHDGSGSGSGRRPFARGPGGRGGPKGPGGRGGPRKHDGSGSGSGFGPMMMHGGPGGHGGPQQHSFFDPCDVFKGVTPPPFPHFGGGGPQGGPPAALKKRQH